MIFSKTKNKLSRNKRTSSPYTITSYNKANVSYEPISLSKSRNVQSRLKSPFHLYLESENSLSYTNYLKRAKEKPKENPINLKKKINSLEEISRNINNIKKIEKKESFTHDNNNATTNNGNVVNILNGTNTPAYAITLGNTAHTKDITVSNCVINCEKNMKKTLINLKYV